MNIEYYFVLLILCFMGMLISPFTNIILRRRLRRISESPVFYPEKNRILVPAVIVDNPPSEVIRNKDILRRSLVHAFVAFIIGIQGLPSLIANAEAAGTWPPNSRVATSPNTTTFNFVAPSIVSGTQTLNAADINTIGIVGVQFKIDGANLGPEDKTVPFSTNWVTTGLQNCSSHSISAIARNSSNLKTTTAIETVIVQNGATVSITAPAAGASVAGTVPITASPTGVCVLLGVQFRVDGVNIGTEDTSAPFSVNLNTTTLTNGSHTLTAIGRNSSGTTTATETIVVNNSNPPPPSSCPGNLIPNPSVETASGGLPANWTNSSWGTNTFTPSYLNTGHSGGHSLQTQVTAFTNGGATWYSSQRAPVTPGQHYAYSDWYQSDVDTELVADILMSDGTHQSFYLGSGTSASAMASTTWRQLWAEFDAPAGAVSMVIYRVVYSNGTLTTDDFCLRPYTPTPFNRGLVSVTYDDGEADQYVNAFPLHTQKGIPATFYIISGLINQSNYMTTAQIQNLNANGMEIGSHSVTHPYLNSLSQANVVNEMSQSQSTLQTLLGGAVTDFAYPYGAYNQTTLAVGQQYYLSQRTSDIGFNSKDNFDPTRLQIQEVLNGTTTAQVQAWIDQANSQKTWLILLFHLIEPSTTPLSQGGSLYTVSSSQLSDILTYINSSGIGTVTMDQARREITPQL